MKARPARTPMLLMLATFVAGILLGRWSGLPVWCAITCTIIFYVIALRRQRGAEVALLLAVMMAGAVAASTERPYTQPPLDQPLTLLATIDEVPTDRVRWQSCSATLRWFRAEGDSVWHRTDSRLMLTVDTSVQLSINQRIAFVGRLRPLSDSVSSYTRLMSHRGYVGRGSIYGSTPMVELGEGGSLRAAVRKLQTRCAERLQSSGLEGDQLALCSAIATGRRGEMSAPLREAYVRSGTAHLLAVSGLHVAILFAVANLLLRWLVLFRRGNLWLNVAVVAVVAGYAAITGFSVSVVRAALMFSALQFAMASGSSYRSANILAVVVMVMLAVRPSLLGDVSFQLSVVAVGAIIYWAIPLCERLRTRNFLLDALLSTIIIGVVCTLATAPIVGWWFGRVAVVGVLLNPLVILLGYALVVLSIAAMITPAFGAVVWAAGAVAEAENRCVVAASQLDWASYEVALDGWVVVLIYLVAIAISELLRRKPRKKSLSLPYV